MKSRKKWVIIIGIIIAVVLVGGLTISSAWTPSRFCGSYGHPGIGHFGMHTAHPGGQMTDFILWKLDRLTGSLNLTDDQQTQYDEMRTAIQTRLEEGIKSHGDFRASVYSEINKEMPDVPLILEGLKANIQSMSQNVEATIDQFTTFYETLDADQRKIIVSSFREKMERQYAGERYNNTE